jgi:hypothetical protein
MSVTCTFRAIEKFDSVALSYLNLHFTLGSIHGEII